MDLVSTYLSELPTKRVYPNAKNYCYPLVNARKNVRSRITSGREYLSVKCDDADTNDPSDLFSPDMLLALKTRFEERSAEIGTKTISNVCQLVLELLHQLQEHVEAFRCVTYFTKVTKKIRTEHNSWILSQLVRILKAQKNYLAFLQRHINSSII